VQKADVNGITMEYEVSGSREPVVFIHGAHIGDSYKPLMRDAALKDFRLIRYRRRGFGGSKADATVPIATQAADCLALMRHLDTVPAHVVGHSLGGAIALQLALDAPDVVRSLALLEPGLLDVPSGAALGEALGPCITMFESGDGPGAVDAFLRVICGEEYRATVERLIPGAVAQAEADAATFFAGEFGALGQWTFTREDAARIRQPVLAVIGAQSEAMWPGWGEIQQRVLDWLPQAKPFVLPGTGHLLQMANPRDLAAGLAGFLHEVSGTPARV